jgi:hypothetical protein
MTWFQDEDKEMLKELGGQVSWGFLRVGLVWGFSGMGYRMQAFWVSHNCCEHIEAELA